MNSALARPSQLSRGFFATTRMRSALHKVSLLTILSLTVVALVACGGGGSGGGDHAGTPPNRDESTVVVPDRGNTDVGQTDEKKPVEEWHVVTTLPELRLNIPVSIDAIDKEHYVSGSGSLNETSGWVSLDNIEIKGRGNSTWGQPKKPYHLKLAAKASLLGMAAGKHWALLANHFDSTLMRNALALDTARRISPAWAPKYQMIELFINDRYLGVYQLAEQVRVGKERVNVKGFKDSKPPASWGYLLEVDFRKKQPHCWDTVKGVPFCVREPKEIDAAQTTYIKDYIGAVEAAIFSSNNTQSTPDYAQYVNEASFIDWFLVNELFKNTDAAFGTSVYLHKDAGNVLNLGPVWDFDLSSGMATPISENPIGWHVRNALWFRQLFTHAQFEQAVRQRWQVLRDAGDLDMSRFIDELAPKLAEARRNNTRRWQDQLPTPFAQPAADDQDITALKVWFAQRLQWLDTQWSYTPVAPTNTAAPLMR